VTTTVIIYIFNRGQCISFCCCCQCCQRLNRGLHHTSHGISITVADAVSTSRPLCTQASGDAANLLRLSSLRINDTLVRLRLLRLLLLLLLLPFSLVYATHTIEHCCAFILITLRCRPHAAVQASQTCQLARVAYALVQYHYSLSRAHRCYYCCCYCCC
jgi:hypothetical protein